MFIYKHFVETNQAICLISIQERKKWGFFSASLLNIWEMLRFTYDRNIEPEARFCSYPFSFLSLILLVCHL